MPSGSQHRGVRAHRLPDQRYATKSQVTYRFGCVLDVGVSRHVAWQSLAVAVAALIKREHPVIRNKQVGAALPLACIPSESVQQERWRSRATEILNRK